MYILYTELDETKHDALLDKYLGLFTEEYQRRLSRFRRWQDAQLSLLGRLLVREGFTRFQQSINMHELCFSHYDKPYLKNNDTLFNISHSGEMAVACIADNYPCIGIDIEQVKPVDVAVFECQMTANEAKRVLNATDRLAAFYTYWTQKEAVLKAHGNGLSIPLQSFEIHEDTTEIDTQRFYTSEIKVSADYCCHIASETPLDTVPITVQNIPIHTF